MKPTTSSRKPLIAYLCLLGLFVVVLWLTGYYAHVYTSGGMVPSAQGANSNGWLRGAWGAFSQSVQGQMSSSVGTLLLQLIVILTAVRFMGWLFKRISQPAVIGEIVAGILLGPSFFGWLSPRAFAWLFPPESLFNIELLSQFGLILFMFTIGMELRIKDIKEQAKHAIIISQAGIYIPFILGIVLAVLVYSKYASEVPFLPFALFTGIAMSITAFPVLARIIQERAMGRTPLGKLALSTAAAGDIIAWLMLAAIMAVTQSGSFVGALFNMLFLSLYLVLIFFVLRPLFDLIGQLYNQKELLSKSIVGVIFILLLGSSYITEVLSMHALFGAFMLGLVMPEDLKFRSVLNEKVEDLSLSLFLPLFFVSSGLRTQLGLIDSSGLWLLFVAYTSIAILGKMGGTYLYARLCGITEKQSLYLGAFMNTRGLMELVVLRIGLDLGVLPPVIFAILVLMTLVTTFMTTPLIQFIDFLYALQQRRKVPISVGAKESKYSVLISFGLPETGVKLLKLAEQLFYDRKQQTEYALLHVTMDSAVNPIAEENYYKQNFADVLKEAKKKNIEIETLHRVSDAPSEEIIRTANKGGYRFLLVGAGLNLSAKEEDRALISFRKKIQRRWKRFSISSPEALLSAKHMFQDKMSGFVTLTEHSVGIFITRPSGSGSIKKLLVAIHDSNDLRLLPFANSFKNYHHAGLDVLPLEDARQQAEEACKSIPQTDGMITILPPGHLDERVQGYSFLFISYATWNRLLDQRLEELIYLPSTLILHAMPEPDLPAE